MLKLVLLLPISFFPNQKQSLIPEMSRIGHDVRQLFDDASSADRENIIRFLELLIRKLKRVADG